MQLTPDATIYCVYLKSKLDIVSYKIYTMGQRISVYYITVK